MEEYTERIVLEGEYSDLKFEILEEREGIEGTVIYDSEADDSIFYRNDVEEWIQEDDSVFSAILTGTEELEDSVIEYRRDEGTAELRIPNGYTEEALLFHNRAGEEGVLTETLSPKS